jgi:hypothetical protein
MGCVTVPETHETMAKIDAIKRERPAVQKPASKALRDYYCPATELTGDAALACADFLERQRELAGAEKLWVMVARSGPEERQQCLAVHRINLRASEAAQREVSPELAARCDALVEERAGQCEVRCRQDLPSCLERQKAQAFALEVESFIRLLMTDAPMLFYADVYDPIGPPVPKCEEEFRTCFRGCMMPR